MERIFVLIALLFRFFNGSAVKIMTFAVDGQRDFVAAIRSFFIKIAPLKNKNKLRRCFYIYEYTQKVYNIIKERRLQNEEVGAVKDP